MAFDIFNYKTFMGGGGQSASGVYKNPYKYNVKISDEELEKLLHKYDNPDDDRYGDMKKRTILNRVFSPLLVGLYTTAGAVKGLVDDDPETGVLSGIGGGLRAANPFGQGYEKGAVTYSNVLEEAGWKPENTAGKIGRGGLGFAMDIALDPLTYATFGISALIKGLGKAGMVATHAAPVVKQMGKELGVKVSGKSVDDVYKVADKVYDNAYNKFGSTKIAEESYEQTVSKLKPLYEGMTIERATDIVKKIGIAKTPEEITMDVDKLVKKYNDVIGLRDPAKAKGITFSLGNAPLGNKIFGKYAKPSFELVSGEPFAKFGEKIGIAKQYSKIRDGLYGTRIGKMFSPNTPLYRASKTNPTDVYRFMKNIEIERGITGGAADAERIIREQAKIFKDLTPAQVKEVVKLCQDNTIMGKVKQLIKLRETKEGVEYTAKMAQEAEELRGVLEDLKSTKRIMEASRANFDNKLVEFQNMQKAVEEEFYMKLANIDLARIKDEEILTSFLKMTDDEFDKLNGKSISYYEKDIEKRAAREAKKDLETLKRIEREGVDAEAPIVKEEVNVKAETKLTPSSRTEKWYDDISFTSKEQKDVFDRFWKYVNDGYYSKAAKDRIKEVGYKQVKAEDRLLREAYVNHLKEKFPFLNVKGLSKDGNTVIIDNIDELKKRIPTANRVMVGNHGVYIEFSKPVNSGNFVKKRLQYNEYNNGKSKLYEQTKGVNYADYKPGKWYVSPYEEFADEMVTPAKSVPIVPEITTKGKQIVNAFGELTAETQARKQALDAHFERQKSDTSGAYVEIDFNKLLEKIRSRGSLDVEDFTGRGKGKVGLFDSEVYNKLPNIDKSAFVDDLSEYIFGKSGVISNSVSGNDLKQIVDLIEKGESKQLVASFIDSKKNIYSGKAVMIWKFIAQKLGYKSWQKSYTETLNGITKRNLSNHDVKIAEIQKQIDEVDPYKAIEYKTQNDGLIYSIEAREKQIADMEQQLKKAVSQTEDGLNKRINMAEASLKRMAGSEHIDELRASLDGFNPDSIRVLKKQRDAVNKDYITNHQKIYGDAKGNAGLEQKLRTETNLIEREKIKYDISELQGVNSTLKPQLDNLDKQLEELEHKKILKNIFDEYDELIKQRDIAEFVDADKIKSYIEEAKKINKMETELIKQNAEKMKVVDKTPEELEQLHKQIDMLKAQKRAKEPTNISEEERLQIADLKQKEIMRRKLFDKLINADDPIKLMTEMDNNALQRMRDEMTPEEFQKLRDRALQASSDIGGINDKYVVINNKKVKLNKRTDIEFSNDEKELFITDYLSKYKNIVRDTIDGKDVYYVRTKNMDKSTRLSPNAVKLVRKYAEKYLVEAEAWINNPRGFNRNYSDLSDGQRKYFLSLVKGNTDFLATGKGKYVTELKGAFNQVADEADKRIASEAARRAVKKEMDNIKSQVDVGSTVSIELRMAAGESAEKTAYQLRAGKVTKISKGQAGETLYTISKENGEIIAEGVTPGQIKKVHKVVTSESTIEDLTKASDILNTFFEEQRAIESIKHGVSGKVEDFSHAARRKNIQDLGRKVDMELVHAEAKQIEKEIAEKAERAKAKVLEEKAEKLGDLENNIKSLELSRIHFEEEIVAQGDKIEVLAEKIKRYEDALNSDAALEIFLRSNMNDADELISKYNPDMGKILLDTRTDIDDKVKEATKFFRSEMIRIGKEEIGIGKLNEEQFFNLMNDYLPHILTADGVKLINSRKVQKKIASFGNKFGYGRKSFNPHEQSRTIKVLPDFEHEGEWIVNPTIEQINEYFKPILKGKNLFSDSIHQIYTARALKHNELMYDVRYTDEMVELFGKDFTGVSEKGYSIVMNYGKMKQSAVEYSRLNVEMEISQLVSAHMKKTKMYDTLRQKAMEEVIERVRYKNLDRIDSFEVKKTTNRMIKDYIKKYVEKEFPDDVRNKMFEGHLKYFSGDSLGDLATPLVQMDASKAQKLNDVFEGNLVDYTSFLKEKFLSLKKSMYFEKYGVKLPDSEIAKLEKIKDIKELKEKMFDISPDLDEVDLERVTRLFDKVDAVEKIKPLQIKQMGDALVQRANQARVLQIAKDQSRFLQLYDKFTHIIKLNQTAVMPTFHLRNFGSNAFNNWLAVGGDAVNPEFQIRAARAVAKQGDVDDMLRIVNKDGVESEIAWKELYQQAEKYGVVNKGYYKDELGVKTGDSGMIPFLPGKFDPTDTENFLLYKGGSFVGNKVESQGRLLHFASQISRGMSFDEAADSVNKFLFDYSDLTAFEANVMKRIIPYYTWLRKNAALQMEMLLEHPEKYMFVGKVMGGVEGCVDEEDRINKFFVNDFALDWVQLPFSVTNPEGRKEPVMWNPNLPFMDFNRIPDPNHPVDSLKDFFSQSNPLIKVPLEQLANRNVFFEQPIVGEKYNRQTKEYESESQMNRVDHVLSQLGLYGIASKLATKKGADLGLELLNDITGLKMLSYDYDKYKSMKIGEMIENNDWSGEEGLIDKTIEEAKKYIEALKRKLSQ